jgi:signal transduction histidine kinase
MPLVANVLRHGAGPIEIRLSRGPGGLRIEVHDDGRAAPFSGMRATMASAAGAWNCWTA